MKAYFLIILVVLVEVVYPSSAPVECNSNCTWDNDCSGSSECPLCATIGPPKNWVCVPEWDLCGQTCQSEMNCRIPQYKNNSCRACIGSECDPCLDCGESCGSDAWCCVNGGKCRVCGQTSEDEDGSWKCMPQQVWEEEKRKVFLEGGKEALEKLLQEREVGMKKIREEAINKKKRKNELD